MNAGNGDNTIGGTVGEQVNDGGSLEAKEHQNKEIPGNGIDEPFSPLTLQTTSTIPVIRDQTKTKEELQTRNKPTSAHSNTDLAQTNGKGGAEPSKPRLNLKRLSTKIGRNLNFWSRSHLQYIRDNDSNELSDSEDVEKPATDNSATDPQGKPEEEIPEQHRATGLSQSLAAQQSISIEQSPAPLSTTTKVGESAEQQDDFQFVETDHVSPELEKASKHKVEIASLKERLAEQSKAIASLNAQLYRNANSLEEQTNGEFSISLQTKANQEYQKKKTPSEGAHNPRFQSAKTRTAPLVLTTTVTTQTKEELQTTTKQTSNTDSTQSNGNKSAGTPARTSKSKVKQFSTTVIRNLRNQNRLQDLDCVLDFTGQIECTDELVVGGFWRAYQGRWIEMAMNAVQPPIAVKVISLPPLIERQQNKQFKHIKHGLELWSKINHKNILPLLGIAYINAAANIPAFVSPWMENGNAKQFRLRNPSFPPLLILYDIIQGLHYLHTYEPQIVHGDIRAINVLINDRNEAQLCEFSQVLVDSSLWRTTATQVGGSLRWMSPELMTGEECTGTKESDIYAFAMTCYEILSGDIPFKLVTREMTVLYNVLLKGQRPERTESCDSDYIWDIITRCWAKKQEDRPHTTEVLELLHSKVNSLALPSRDFGP